MRKQPISEVYSIDHGKTKQGEEIPHQYGGWWIGLIEIVPGVNCQERTHEELLGSLKSTLIEAMKFKRYEGLK